jgi:putative PIN family toxin of toxin-antitoxin system
MNLPTVIVDTNVVVAGLITKDPKATVCQILDAMLSGRLPYLLSADLLNEYAQVLSRPIISRYHGLIATEVDCLLEELTANAIWREPPTLEDAPDPGDNHLWSLLKTQHGGILVTGDQLLVGNPPADASVLIPKHFFELFMRL